ncbi:hypothetical protein COCVIDRAFT_39417 [Bipolaris victoriae FI3]|uniref:Secreted protein n=2 Tax=Bipolaris TaxID=33194 RepID=W7ELN6_BIPV3|nr:hypothetical protein COCVIDRAFT_39417 [Bipolaris victoriae FI3]
MVVLLTLLAHIVAAIPEAWFPDVWGCRCHSAEKDLPLVQPICNKFGGTDTTIYPPAKPDPFLGRLVWCQKISLKSAPRANRLADVFTDATCQEEFGAGFVAQCKNQGYTLCFGEEECY